jgi:hypothetical protein
MFEMEPTEEQVAAWDRNQMIAQDLYHRMRRLVAEELSVEQLEVLLMMMKAITRSSNPLVMAEWYEGMVFGAQIVRDVRLGERAGSPDDE